MNKQNDEIVSRFESLSPKEQSQLATALSQHFGKTIQFSASGLSALDSEELKIVNDTISGMILTKEYVPDILGQYKQMANMDLPQKIAFGRLKDSEQ